MLYQIHKRQRRSHLKIKIVPLTLLVIVGGTLVGDTLQANSDVFNGSLVDLSSQAASEPSPTTPPATTNSATNSASVKPSTTSGTQSARSTTDTTMTSTQPPAEVYQVNDQFTGTALDPNLWQAMTTPVSPRNNEEEDYRPSQVTVQNGYLQITAERDAQGQWHSGEVYSKWSYTYGEFEVRMALSAGGAGSWPAAWLLGTTDTWPNNGEVDIMENINGTNTVYGTVHANGSNGSWKLQSAFAPIDVTQFHTYKVIKQPGVVSWWIDGVKRAEWQPSQMPAGGVWPFDNHRYLGILNLAIGGDWSGPSNVSTPNPIIMSVDYYTVKNAS